MAYGSPLVQSRGLTPALFDNVEKTVTALLDKQFKELPVLYTKLFKKMDSTKKFERIVTLAPFGDVPEKPEGNPYAFDIIQQGYTKDLTPTEYGMGFEITETAEEDDQYDELKKKTKYLMFAMRQVEEKAAAAVFNNGFTTQLSADGVALFSTAHLLKRGGTARNEPAVDADLTITSLGQAFIDLATDTKLESGQLGAPPTEYYLVVPAASEFIAHTLIKSTGLPGTADNDINAVKAARTITVVVNPFLTDADAWFLVPVDKERHGLVYLQRIGITMAPIMTAPYTGNKLVKLRARKAWDAWDWRNTYGVGGAA